MLQAPDTIARTTRRTLAREVLACLEVLRMPLQESVPYLADLLDSTDDDILLGVLEYLDRAKLVDAAPYVEGVLRRPRLSPPVREAAFDTLRALGA